MQAGERLLGDEHAVAQHLVLREVERRVEDGDEGVLEVVVLAHHARELLRIRLDGLTLDLVEGVKLGLEVVVQRRRADAHGLRYVGPLAVLVAVAPERLGRDAQDLPALAARGLFGPAVPALLGGGHARSLPQSKSITTVPSGTAVLRSSRD